MTQSISRFLSLGRRALLAALFLLPAALQAQVVISSVPYTISSPGKYVLSFNMAMGSASGAAITVASNDVDLDLGGYNLIGGSASSAGIYVSGANAVHVRNGWVTGFPTGVQVGSSADVELTALSIGGCQTGMYLVGQDLNVHGNLVKEIVSSTTTTGIFAAGQSIRIWDNTIRNIRSTGSGYSSNAILINSWVGDFTWGSVEGNRIYMAAGLANSYGIAVMNTSTINILGNQVFNTKTGMYYAGSGGSIKYGNNVVTGATTPYGAGTDIGNNH
jgi:parallel beta-helix repeat protein